MSRIAVLDAPSVLGLRPPAPGEVPGARRLPEALRRHRLLERLGATDAPDLDPDGRRAGELADTVVAGLAPRA